MTFIPHVHEDFEEAIKRFNLIYVDPSLGSSKVEKLNYTASVSESKCLTDYGRFHRLRDSFWLYEPVDLDQLIECLNFCARNNIPFSCRGAGHSMNGRSLPLPHGLLISTIHLNQVSLVNSTEVLAECGTQVFEIDRWLRALGYQLPVVHDGGLPGPTLGGFIAAGGFGCTSDRRGGFWNHIKEVKIWQKKLGVVTVPADSPLFLDICGSGQPNGFILSARLNIDCLWDNREAQFPKHERLEFQFVAHPRLLWFTFIAPLSQYLSLRRELSHLHLDLSTYWKPLDPYQYKIKFLGRPTPSGFHSMGTEDLIASGVWGEVDSISDQDIGLMLEKVNTCAFQFENTSRYWQSEL